MDLLRDLMDLFLKLQDYLPDWEARLGLWLYLVVFAIIFCETGLVVTPFLPGDSLLFALGTRAADPASPLDFWLLFWLIAIAGIVGDAVNYWIGHFVGPRVFTREDSWLLNKKHLLRTHAFYERHGGKTIILARFIPIIRTFAPFVAGVGSMTYWKFAVYNVVGALLWVTTFLTAGYFLGSVEIVRKNFSFVILGIIVVSVLPLVVELFLGWRRSAKAKADAAAGAAPGSP
jgi:membrane-associated protein